MVNRRDLFLAGLLISTPLTADQVINHKSGTFFTKGEMETIFQHVKEGEDLIVLYDGTVLKGKVPQLPLIPFKIGKIPLQLNDALAIAFSNDSEKDKIQIITRDGYLFVVDMPSEKIGLLLPNMKKELDPRAVSHILFAQRQASTTPRPSRLHTLQLNNGDQIPVVIAEDTIRLSNGWEDISLKPEEIIDLSFDGGLYGTVYQNGKEKELDFSFVKDPYLHVQVVKSSQVVGIPWNQLISIKKEDPRGFKDSLRYLGKKDGPAQKSKQEIAYTSNKQAPLKQAEAFKTSSKDLEKQVVDAVRERMLLEQELQNMRRINGNLTHSNQELAQKIQSFETVENELHRKEGNLATQIELEMTRAQVLKKSLSDVYAKWQAAKEQNSSLKKKVLSGNERVALENIKHELAEYQEVTNSTSASQAKSKQEARDALHREFIAKIQDLTRYNDEALAQNGSLEYQLTNLHASLEESLNRATQLKRQLDQAVEENHRLQPLEKKMELLAEQFSEEKERADLIKKDLASALKQAEERESDVATFYVRMQQAEEMVGRLENALEAKNLELANLTLTGKEYEEKIAEAQQRLSELEEKLERQQYDLIASEQEINHRQESFSVEKQQLTFELEKQELAYRDILKAESARLNGLLSYERNKIQELEEALTAVRDELYEKQATSQTAIETLEKLNAQREELTQGLEQELAGKNQELAALSNAAKEFEEKVAASQSRISALEEALEHQRELLTAGAQEHLNREEALSAEKQQLTAELEKLEFAHQDILAAESARLNGLLSYERNKIQELEEALTAVRDELYEKQTTSQTAIETLENEVRVQGALLAGREEDIFGLGKTLAMQEESSSEKINELSSALELKEQEKVDLQQQIADLSQRFNETEVNRNLHTEQAARIQEELDQVLLQLEFVNRKAQEENVKWVAENERFEQKIHDQETFIVEMQQDLVSLKDALFAKDEDIFSLGETLTAQKEAFSQKLQVLTDTLDKKEVENNDLQLQLQGYSVHTSALQTALSKDEYELAASRMEMRAKLQSLQSQYDLFEDEIKRLSQLASNEKERADFNEEAAVVVRKELHDIKETFNLMEGQLEEALAKASSVENALNSYQLALEEKDQDIFRLGETLDTQKQFLSAKILALSSELERKELERQSLQEELHFITKQVHEGGAQSKEVAADLEAKLGALQQELVYFQHAVESKDHEIFGLGETLSAQKEAYNNKIQTLATTLERIETERNGLKNQLDTLGGQLTQGEKSQEERQQSLERELEYLTDELNQQKSLFQKEQMITANTKKTLEDQLILFEEKVASLTEELMWTQDALSAKDQDVYAIGETLTLQKESFSNKIQGLSEEIIRKEAEKVSLQQRIDALALQIEKIKFDSRHVEEYALQLEQERAVLVEELSQQITRAQKEQQALTFEKKELEEKLASAESNFLEIEEELLSSRKTIGEKDKELIEIGDKLHKEIEGLTQQIEQSEFERQRLMEYVSRLESERMPFIQKGEASQIATLDKQLESLKDLLEEKDHDLYRVGETLVSQKEDFSGKLQQLAKEKSLIISERDQLKDEIANLQIVEHRTRDLAKVQQQYAQLELELISIKEALEAKDNDLYGLGETLALQKSKFNALANELERKNAENQSLHQQLQSLTYQVEEREAFQGQHQQKINQLENELARISQDSVSQRSDVEKEREAKYALEVQLSQLQSELAASKGVMKGEQSDLASLQKIVYEQEQTFAATLQHYKNTILEIEEDREALRRQLQSQSDSTADHRKTQESILFLSDLKNALEQKLAASESKSAQLQQELRGAKAQIENKSKDMYGQSENFSSQKQAYAAKLETLTAELERKDWDYLAIEQKYTATADKNQQLESILAQNSSEFDKIKQDFKRKQQSHQDQCSYFEEEIAQLKGDHFRALEEKAHLEMAIKQMQGSWQQQQEEKNERQTFLYEQMEHLKDAFQAQSNELLSSKEAFAKKEQELVQLSSNQEAYKKQLASEILNLKQQIQNETQKGQEVKSHLAILQARYENELKKSSELEEKLQKAVYATPKKEAPTPVALAELPQARSEIFVPKEIISKKTPQSKIAIDGYDPLHYYSGGKPRLGMATYEHEFNGNRWRFSSKENLNAFMQSPNRYIAQYRGNCPWAMANGSQMEGLPHVWKIIDNKLYLFSSHDAMQKWTEAGESLRKTADHNWKKMADS